MVSNMGSMQVAANVHTMNFGWVISPNHRPTIPHGMGVNGLPYRGYGVIFPY